ncbi:hypothetical protein CaCOL14_011912 [Colletotrichum acutatum]
MIYSPMSPMAPVLNQYPDTRGGEPGTPIHSIGNAMELGFALALKAATAEASQLAFRRMTSLRLNEGDHEFRSQGMSYGYTSLRTNTYAEIAHFSFTPQAKHALISLGLP